MTEDFSKYKNIIEKFRGKVLQSDFENKFVAATKKFPKTETFLLKMELKRLAQPCTRLIDLRGLVDGECRAFEHDGRTHFLDDIAIKVFDENIAHYQNYTFGVYEAVKNTENNFRVIYQKEKSGNDGPAASDDTAKVLEKTQYPAKLFSFGPYFNRSQERMNFSVNVEITFSAMKMVECSTSDISVCGCKLRLLKPGNFEVGQEVGIRFRGLEQEFEFGETVDFIYIVRNIQLIDNVQLIGLERAEIPGQGDGFSRFLAGFIQGNKRRYKINLDNTINALQARTFEQYVLPQLNELPIFVVDNQGQYLPRYALTCPNNQANFEYWQDEKKSSTLHCLLPKERIARLQRAKRLGKSLFVYSFVHIAQGKAYFYTADDKQLSEDKDFIRQFFSFAAKKPTFRITELSIIDVNPEHAQSEFTLADAIEKKDEYLNQAISEEVKDIVDNLPYVVVATDVTDKRIVEEYKEISESSVDTAKLKALGHKRSAASVAVDQVGINYNNQRQEPRFFYKTPTVIEAQGVKWQGESVDFSISGMKVEIDKSAMLVKGEVVYLTFPKLQKITSSFELVKLPYEVMRINEKRTVVNLRVHVEKHQHIGRSFFKLLIEKNKSKLTADEYVMMTPGLARSLRNIYSQSMPTASLIIQTSGSRYKIETITAANEEAPFLATMKQLSNRRGFYNLYPLLHNLQATNLMSQGLKKIQAGDPPLTDILYVAINPNVEQVDKAVTSKLDSELGTAKMKCMFMANAMKNGLFFCLQVKMSRVLEPDIKHLNPELSYVGSYAIHRGKQLEQEIYSVAGVIEMFDITQEAMMRFNAAKR